jgi:peptidoglycan/LPS O-acetylase OafA/YrhL
LFACFGQLRGLRNVVCQFLGLGLICACIWGPYEEIKNAKCAYNQYTCPDPGYTFSRTQNNFYNTFSRPALAVGLSLIMAAWIYGEGESFSRWFFTWPLFSALGKLSYGAYLWHLVFVLGTYYTQRNPLQFTFITIFTYSCAFIAMSFGAALVTHLFVEGPFGQLQSWAVASLFAKAKRTKEYRKSSAAGWRGPQGGDEVVFAEVDRKLLEDHKTFEEGHGVGAAVITSPATQGTAAASNKHSIDF